ncbi:HD domain-containing protein, partial [Patescibacteria group bacterium]|nr:HD domain-containing protein [Patescibacteria group bacterium]
MSGNLTVDEVALAGLEDVDMSEEDLLSWQAEMNRNIDSYYGGTTRSPAAKEVVELKKQQAKERLNLAATLIAENSNLAMAKELNADKHRSNLQELAKKVEFEKAAVVAERLLGQEELSFSDKAKTAMSSTSEAEVKKQRAVERHNKLRDRLTKNRLHDRVVAKTQEFVDSLIEQKPHLKPLRNRLMSIVGEKIKSSSDKAYEANWLYQGVADANFNGKFSTIERLIADSIEELMGFSANQDFINQIVAEAGIPVSIGSIEREIGKVYARFSANKGRLTSSLEKEVNDWISETEELGVDSFKKVNASGSANASGGFELAKELDLISYRSQQEELASQAKSNMSLVNSIVGRNTPKNADLSIGDLGILGVTPWIRFFDVRSENENGVSAHNMELEGGKYALWLPTQIDQYPNFRFNMNSSAPWSLNKGSNNLIGKYNMVHELLHLAAHKNGLYLDEEGQIQQNSISIARTEGMVRWLSMEAISDLSMFKRSAEKGVYLGLGDGFIQGEFAQLTSQALTRTPYQELSGQGTYLGGFQGFRGEGNKAYRANIELIEKIKNGGVGDSAFSSAKQANSSVVTLAEDKKSASSAITFPFKDTFLEAVIGTRVEGKLNVLMPEDVKEIASFVRAHLEKKAVTLEQAEVHWTHIKNMTNIGVYQAMKDGADLDVVLAACLLHDIAKEETDDNLKNLVSHHIMGAQIAEEKLRELNKPDEFISRVVFAIKSHMGPLGTKADNISRFMTKMVNMYEQQGEKIELPEPASLESEIVRDADMLELMNGGIVKIVVLRQTVPLFFQEGVPEKIAESAETGRESAWNSVQEANAVLKRPFAKELGGSILARTRRFLDYMQNEFGWNVGGVLEFKEQYADYTQHQDIIPVDRIIRGDKGILDGTASSAIEVAFSPAVEDTKQQIRS